MNKPTLIKQKTTMASQYMILKDAHKKLQREHAKLQEEHRRVCEEHQKVLAFANERNVQIYSQVYIAALGVNDPDPDKVAIQSVKDLQAAFGYYPSATH